MDIKLCRVMDHQNKSNAYKQALEEAGYLFTTRMNVQGLRFMLADADWRPDDLENARQRGVPYFLYPHAARPMVQYDGCVEPHPVTAMFTHAEGGRELMKIIGYPYPVEVCGWSYSEIRPFRPVEDVKSVLFAPIHPNGNKWLSKVDQDLNRKTFNVLYDWCRDHGAELHIRHISHPDDSGLMEAYTKTSKKLDWHEGRKNNSTADMEDADLIVAHQTFAYLAVALGKPTVMMGEDVPPRSGNSDAGFSFVKHWDSYKDLLMFPLDILSGDPDEVIRTAVSTDKPIKQWRDRYIGKPFDGPGFVKTLESYL